MCEFASKLDEQARHASDATAQKSRLQSENASLLSQLEEAESQISAFAKVRQQMNAQVEEARRVGEDEARARASLQQQLRNLSGDFGSLKTQFDDEQATKVELQRLLSKAHVEAQQWRFVVVQLIMWGGGILVKFHIHLKFH